MYNSSINTGALFTKLFRLGLQNCLTQNYWVCPVNRFFTRLHGNKGLSEVHRGSWVNDPSSVLFDLHCRGALTKRDSSDSSETWALPGMLTFNDANFSPWGWRGDPRWFRTFPTAQCNTLIRQLWSSSGSKLANVSLSWFELMSCISFAC